MHPIACNKGKEPIVPDDVDTPEDDKLSSVSSPSLSLSPAKNTMAKLRKRPSHRLAFNDTVRRTTWGKVRSRQGAKPARSTPRASFDITRRRNTTNATCTFYLRYRAKILHAPRSLNSGTRRHALFAPRATHS